MKDAELRERFETLQSMIAAIPPQQRLFPILAGGMAVGALIFFLGMLAMR